MNWKITKPLSLFIFIAFSMGTLIAQPTIQDCAGAISICQPIYVENTSPSGMGNVPNEINSHNNPGGFVCMADERNSIWYRFTVDNTGDFGFLIKPNDPDDDYDWALFNITNADCSQITSDASLMVSCNAAGGGQCDGDTGANGGSNFNIQGGGCDNNPPSVNRGFRPVNALIPVQAGNTYVLCISNWSSSTNGYEIDFGLSSNIGIFDVVPPTLVDVDYPDQCAERDVILTFSENIDCATMQAGNFGVSGPGPNFTQHNVLLISGGNCINGGGFENVFTLTLDPPISEPGMYEFFIVDEMEISDLCGNSLMDEIQLTFNIAPDQFPMVDLGPDQTDCFGKTISLDATIPDAMSYRWQDASSNPMLDATSSGQYFVEISMNNGCVARDTVELTFERDLSLNIGNDTTFCRYDPYTIDVSQFAGTYEWQDGSTNSSFEVDAGGLYWVEIRQADGCLLVDSIRVTEFFDNQTLDIGRDTTICFGTSLRIDLNYLNGLSHIWSDGLDQSLRDITEEGQYAVSVESRDCSTYDGSINVFLEDCTPCHVFFPNIFSPNGDNINDAFIANISCNFTDYNLIIFDRWGNQVFSSEDPQIGWDGSYKGKKAAAGVYVYAASYRRNRQTLRKQGDIMLVR